MSSQRSTPAHAGNYVPAERHDQLEGRVTGLERDVQHMTRSIETLGHTVDRGFNETRNMFSSMQQQLVTLGEREMKKGQVSWPLVVSIMVLVLAAIGAGVSFVTMSLSPVDDKLDSHIRAGGHTDTLLFAAKADESFHAIDFKIDAERRLFEAGLAAEREIRVLNDRLVEERLDRLVERVWRGEAEPASSKRQRALP